MLAKLSKRISFGNEKCTSVRNFFALFFLFIILSLSAQAEEQDKHKTENQNGISSYDTTRAQSPQLSKPYEPKILPKEFFEGGQKFLANLGNQKGIRLLQTIPFTDGGCPSISFRPGLKAKLYSNFLKDVNFEIIRSQCIQFHMQWYCTEDNKLELSTFCVERSFKQKVDIGFALKCADLLKANIAVDKFAEQWDLIGCAKKIHILDTLELLQTDGGYGTQAEY